MQALFCGEPQLGHPTPASPVLGLLGSYGLTGKAQVG